MIFSESQCIHVKNQADGMSRPLDLIIPNQFLHLLNVSQTLEDRMS